MFIKCVFLVFWGKPHFFVNFTHFTKIFKKSRVYRKNFPENYEKWTTYTSRKMVFAEKTTYLHHFLPEIRFRKTSKNPKFSKNRQFSTIDPAWNFRKFAKFAKFAKICKNLQKFVKIIEIWWNHPEICRLPIMESYAYFCRFLTKNSKK